SFRRFERSWQWADYWAVVVPPEGVTPVTAQANRYLAAVAALEEQQRWHPARQGYLAASRRWPENPNSYMGLGNMAYHQGDYAQAEQHFREAIGADAEAPAGYYNLAWALLRQYQHSDSLAAATKAQQLAPEHPRYGSARQQLKDAADH
ncbi:MAG: tetratricopeptide repeat protein, partial [Halomonadaceae bacterium]